MPIPTISYERRPLNPERLRAILAFAGKSVLDVGCGNGSYVQALGDRYVIRGVDIRPFEAWSARRGRFAVSGTLATLPFADKSVDTVTCFETLEHLQDPAAAVREFARIARQNVIITVPNCDITPGMRGSLLAHYHWVDRTHVSFFDVDRLERLVVAAALTPVEVRLINPMSFVPLLEEAFWIPRLLRLPFRRAAAAIQRRPYFLTCLVVAAHRPASDEDK